MEFGFFNAFFNAGIVSKLVILLLVAMSVYSWAMIFRKYSACKTIEKEYSLISSNLAKRTIVDLAEYKNHRYFIYASFFNFILDSSRSQSKSIQEVRIQSEVILSHTSSMVSNKLYHLGSMANSAPFLGLFGTVIGVINSFQQIGLTSSVSLAVIAPGIAESLYATAFGLFVAVPASVFFNIFNNKINQYEENHELLLEQILYTLQKHRA